MRKRGIVVALAITLPLLGPALGHGQKQKWQPRTVYGTVVDRQDNSIGSGLVYLKNLQTRMVRTYIADQGGRYRFTGLDPKVAYEIHAEHRDLTSAIYKISSSDAHKEIVIKLRVDTKKFR